MAITYTIDTKGQSSGAAITSNALTVATGDFVTVLCVMSDNSDSSAWTVSNTGTAITWTLQSETNTAGNCKVVLWSGIAGATPPTTVTVTATAGGNPTAAKFLVTAAHTGAHATTPLPAGNIFPGVGLTDASRTITPTASGSALWMVCGDWNATNSFAAGANCSLNGTFHDATAMSCAAIRPTTQPRTDGAAFTLSETDTSGVISYIAFEVQAASGGGAPQTLTDTLFTNTNTFFSDTIVGGAVATAFQADAFQNDAFQIEAGGTPQTLTDTLFTNSNTFFSDTIVPGSVTLTDSLFTNTNTFFADIINQAGGPQTLVDSLYTNTNTFFADTIVPGSRTLVDSLFTNTNTFFSDTIVNSSGAVMVQWESSVDPNVTGYFVYWDTVSHAGGVYTDYAFSADVSGNAADQYLITGLTVGQTYFINISSHGAGGHDANESALWGEITDTASDLGLWQFLTDGLRYENPNTFFSDTITQPGGNQTLTDTLFTNTNTFFSDTIVPGAVTLADSLYTNTNTFFADTIQPGTVTLSDTLFTNTNTFFSDTISQAGGAQTLVDSLFTNDNTFFADTIQPGSVTLSDSLFTNTNQFFSDTITQGAPNQTLVDSLFTNTNQFFTDTVVVGDAVLTDSLFVNTNQFFNDIIIGGAQPVIVIDTKGYDVPYKKEKDRKKDLRKRIERIIDEYETINNISLPIVEKQEIIKQADNKLLTSNKQIVNYNETINDLLSNIEMQILFLVEKQKEEQEDDDDLLLLS